MPWSHLFPKSLALLTSGLSTYIGYPNPHLSRITETIIVQHWLQLAIASPNLKLFDQFGFKSSGSTTAAVVYFTHQLTKMLEQNDYVRYLMVDFYQRV